MAATAGSLPSQGRQVSRMFSFRPDTSPCTYFRVVIPVCRGSARPGPSSPGGSWTRRRLRLLGPCLRRDDKPLGCVPIDIAIRPASSLALSSRFAVDRQDRDPVSPVGVGPAGACVYWVPAFAGMTSLEAAYPSTSPSVPRVPLRCHPGLPRIGKTGTQYPRWELGPKVPATAGSLPSQG